MARPARPPPWRRCHDCHPLSAVPDRCVQSTLAKRADGSGASSQPGFASGGHPQARRARPDGGRPRAAPFVWNALEQGRRSAQAAMRHSTINLTMSTYTDPKLLDVHGALDALPALSLKADPISPCGRAMATGTDDLRRFPLAPVLAPTSVQAGQKPSFGDRGERITPARPDPPPVGTMSFADKRKGPSTTLVNGPGEVERKGVEPSTSALRTQPLRDVSYSAEGVATSDPAACTAACTGNAISANDNAGSTAQNDLDLEAVVEAWPALPDSLRQAIVTLVKAARIAGQHTP
jgi:hypothetical protein